MAGCGLDDSPHPKTKPGMDGLAAVPAGWPPPLPRSAVEAVSCEDCCAGPQDSAGTEGPSTHGVRLTLAAGSAGAMHLFGRPDRLMLEVFNIVGIILK